MAEAMIKEAKWDDYSTCCHNGSEFDICEAVESTFDPEKSGAGVARCNPLPINKDVSCNKEPELLEVREQFKLS